MPMLTKFKGILYIIKQESCNCCNIHCSCAFLWFMLFLLVCVVLSDLLMQTYISIFWNLILKGHSTVMLCMQYFLSYSIVSDARPEFCAVDIHMCFGVPCMVLVKQPHILSVKLWTYPFGNLRCYRVQTTLMTFASEWCLSVLMLASHP
jgi:hypothetical protein